MNRPVSFLAMVVTLFAIAAMLGCSRSDTPADAQTRVPATSQPAAVPAAAELPRIVFLGDSLTAGLGIAKAEAVPALIQARLREEGYDYEVINAGNSGDTSDGGLSRLDWSLAGNVEVLVVELGANDGLRGVSPVRTGQNLEKIVRTARSRDVAVLLTGMEAPPNYGAAYTTQFRDTFRRVAEQEHVAFMPFFLEGVAGVRSLNQPDGIHPTPEGARIIAMNLWRYLEPLLEKK